MLSANSRLRIVVQGYIVRGPLGGMIWSNLQFLMGLRDCGHDVFFVEDSDDYPSCYDPEADATGTDSGYGLRFARAALDAIGFGDRWAYFDAHALGWVGPCAASIDAVLEHADVLLNLCGVNPHRPWFERIPRKVYVDEDPVFTQVRNLQDPGRREYVRRHDVFLTFAENFGQPDCTVPDDGFPWRPLRQPVVLRALAASPPHPGGPFTTVMQWQSYEPVVHRNVRYGMKADSFAEYVDIPGRTRVPFELALGGGAFPRAALAAHGWTLRDPRGPTRTVATYLDYIRQSRAEFSVAKHGYVISNSGWFSERSATYLALGRPVVVQETGFSRSIASGEGVLAFSTPQGAVEAVAEVLSRYDFHCRRAREVAAARFDSRAILPAMLETVMQSMPPPA